jgi:hypothetical protein
MHASPTLRARDAVEVDAFDSEPRLGAPRRVSDHSGSAIRAAPRRNEGQRYEIAAQPSAQATTLSGNSSAFFGKISNFGDGRDDRRAL